MNEFIIILGIFAVMAIALGIAEGWEFICRKVNPSTYTTTLDRAVFAIYREIENV